MHTCSCSIVRSQPFIMHSLPDTRDSFLISFGSDKCCYCRRARLIVYSRIPNLEMEPAGPCTQMGGGVFHVFKFLSCRRTFGSSGSRHQTLCPFAILGTYLLFSSVTVLQTLSPLLFCTVSCCRRVHYFSVWPGLLVCLVCLASS